MKAKNFNKPIVLLIALIMLFSTVISPVMADGGGYDQWGYNYQANMFNGGYCDAYQDASWCQPYRDVRLMMKWNDAWRDENGIRHEGFPTYIGSGAWLTNHQSGEYEQDGQTCKWSYFVKIKAAPSDGYVEEGNWYSADGTLLGSVIWGQFFIGQQIENDACAGLKGVLYLIHPGLGN